MKKIRIEKIQTKKINREWFRAVALNLLILAAVLILFLPRSEAGDDSVMNAILSGGYGTTSCHAVFINIFLSGMIEFLYKVFPIINWYVVIQYILIFLAMIYVTKICFEKFGHYFGDILMIILLSLVYYEHYIAFQFSKTSSLLVGAGCFIIFHLLKNEEKKYRHYILPGIFLLAGSMLRFYSYLFTMAIFLIVGLRAVVELLRKKDWRQIARYFIVFGVICMVCFSCRLGNQYLYQKNTGWSEYQYYNDLRGKVRDFPILPYEGNEEIYESIGMSENDYENLMDWNIADPKFYTSELFENILKITAENQDKMQTEDEGSVFIRFLKKYPKKYFSIKAFDCFLILILLCLICCKRKKSILFQACFSAIPGILISFYLFYVGRYGLNRIDTGIWLGVILVFLYSLNMEEMPVLSSKKLMSIYLISLVTFTVAGGEASGYLRSKSEAYVRSIDNLKELYECLELDKSKVYFMDATSSYKGQEYNLLEPHEKGYGDNVIWLGGWLTNSPIVKHLWKNYGVKNPYKDVINSDEVFFIEKQNNISTKVKYIREHYKKKVRSVLLKNINGYKIYAIRSKKYKLDLSEYTMISASENKNIKKKYETTLSNNNIVINGYFFEKGEESFNQTVYLKAVDKETGEIKYRNTTKYKSGKYKKSKNGKYGAFKISITYDEEYLENHSFSLILESNGQYYETALKINLE